MNNRMSAKVKRSAYAVAFLATLLMTLAVAPAATAQEVECANPNWTVFATG